MALILKIFPVIFDFLSKAFYCTHVIKAMAKMTEIPHDSNLFYICHGIAEIL